MSMSRCSWWVLTVCGRVGLVDDGQHVALPGDRDDVGSVAAAGALGVVGVDASARRWPRRVDSHEPGLVERVGVDGDLDAGRVADPQAGVDRGGRGAPVLVQLEARRRPPRSCSSMRLVDDGVALAEQRDVDRACRPSPPGCGARYHAPGVTVVALVPSAGPVPPPISVVTPLARASSTICGQIRWTWQSMAPAVRILPLPAMISVRRPDHQVRVRPRPWCRGCRPCRCATIRPSRTPTSALTIAPVVEDRRRR